MGRHFRLHEGILDEYIRLSRMRPALCYQPPNSIFERNLWSNVHRYCLTEVSRVAEKILDGGKREGRLFRDGFYIVALNREYVKEIGRTLDRGGWACLRTEVYGENLVELYAQVHDTSYVKGIQAIAGEAGLATTNEIF